MQNLAKNKICIIGAGPRGLLAARHLSQSSQNEIHVFETKSDVGGMWLFEDKSELNSNAEEIKQKDNFYQLHNSFQGSLYQNLVSNLPHFFMEYKDLSFRDMDPNFPPFVTVAQYQKYFVEYAKKFDLNKHITFNTLVKSVRLTKNLTKSDSIYSQINKEKKFTVVTVDSEGGQLNENLKVHGFDYVIVASGQYSIPYIPTFEGVEKFTGKQIHAKNFNSPKAEYFKDKSILILGGGASLDDMLVNFFSKRDNVDHIKRVINCATKTQHIGSSDNFTEFIKEGKLELHNGSIKEFKENSCIFTDGSEQEVDIVVYATGYKLEIPYLDYENDKIVDYDPNTNRGQFFGPLYRRFVSIRHPEMFFLGFIEQTTMLHIIPELQVLIIKCLLDGKLTMPTEDEMMKNYQEQIDEHLKYCGNLSRFFRANVLKDFPEYVTSFEDFTFNFYREWLKKAGLPNDDEKSEKFVKMLGDIRKVIFGEKSKGNYISYRKIDFKECQDYSFRNTSEFI